MVSNTIDVFQKCKVSIIFHTIINYLIGYISYILGVLVVAPTVHQAFDEIYYLERACKIQLLAMQAVGGDKEKLSLLSEKGLYKTVAESYTKEMIDIYSKRHFYSYWDMYLRNEPEVFS